SLWTPEYTFTAISDNPDVVTNDGVVVTGSGTDWTVTVNPVVNACGSATITVTGVDRYGQQSTGSFRLDIAWDGTCWARPAPCPDQRIPAGGTAVVGLRCLGLSRIPVALDFLSSNTNLVPVGNIKLVGTNLLIWPVGALTGSARITVGVTSVLVTSTNLDFL